MARPRRRIREPQTRLGQQVAFRQAQQAGIAVAEPPTDLEARGQATSVGGIQGLPGPPEPPSVLEGEGPPPPPSPAEQPAAVPVEQHPAAGFEQMHPEFASRLQALFAASGGRVYAGQGFRSYEGQVAAWNAAVAKYGEAEAPNWAARPGHSNHGRGLAMDIKGDYDLAHRLAPQFGLVFPMDNEPWHIEPVGLRQHESTPPTAYTSAGIKEKPSIVETIQGDNGPVDVPVENMAKFAEMAAFNEIDFAKWEQEMNPARHLGEQQTVATPEGTPKVLEGEGPPPPAPEPGTDATTAAVQGGEPPEGDMDSIIRWAMQMEGITDEQAFATAHHRMMVESGGQNIEQQITDVNSGGNEAFGPWQFVRGTFQRFARPGFEDWHNPAHQALAFFRAVRMGKYRGNFAHPELTGSGGWSP